MKRYGTVSLSILLLAGVMLGASLWARLFFDSVQNYRSPLAKVDLPLPRIDPETAAPTRRMIVVVLGGLGYDDSLALNLPVFEQLKKVGAWRAVQSTPPTYAQTSWATLFTGAPPDSNDAPPLDQPVAALRPLAVDTIFNRVHYAGQKTAFVGPAYGQAMVPPNPLHQTFAVNQPGPEADQTVLQAALPLIENNEARLIVIQFTQLELAGKQQGTPGEAYKQAALALDGYLGQISAAADLSHTVLMVLSDRGHIPDGGAGGSEPEVIWQPLIILGENIIPGSYSDAHQTDIAPTMAALLGLPGPTAAQGRAMTEIFTLSPPDRARLALTTAQQRLALTQSYLKTIQGEDALLPSQLSKDLTRAYATFAAGNIEGAAQLARLTWTEANTHLAAAVSARKQSEFVLRAVVSIAAMGGWFILMWRKRGNHAGLVLIATLITITLYHTQYQLQGYSYSVSAVGNPADLPFEIARRAGLSILAGGGVLLVLLLLMKEDNWLTLLGTGYGFSALITFIFMLPLTWGYWQNGMVVNWHLPEINAAYWQVFGLFEVLTAAMFGLLLPWPIMTLNMLVSLVRHTLSDTRAKKPGALPGLHL